MLFGILSTDAFQKHTGWPGLYKNLLNKNTVFSFLMLLVVVIKQRLQELASAPHVKNLKKLAIYIYIYMYDPLPQNQS